MNETCSRIKQKIEMIKHFVTNLVSELTDACLTDCLDRKLVRRIVPMIPIPNDACCGGCSSGNFDSKYTYNKMLRTKRW